MNVLRLHLLEGEIVDIEIDGERLIPRLGRIEEPQASREGHPEIAGSYRGLTRFDWNWDDRDDEGRMMILGCICGFARCWPMYVRVVATAETVTWSDFASGHREEWSYSDLGPFVFERKAYEAEVSRLNLVSGLEPPDRDRDRAADG